MSKVIAFAVIENVIPQQAFVAADADVFFGGAELDGRLFLASKRGEVAACAEIENVFAGDIDICRLAARRQLCARAEIEDRNGLAIVTRLWLFSGPQWAPGAWIDGAPLDQLHDTCRTWWGHIAVARMARGHRDTLPVPKADRPHGNGEVIEIDIRGEIGTGRNTAQRVGYFLGPRGNVRRTAVINLDSTGGNCAEGLEMYRRIAAHPCATYCNIGQRASSMAAIVSMAADIRTIIPAGRMLLHRPAIEGFTSRLEATDPRRAADELERMTSDLAGIVALRTDQPLATAWRWIDEGKEFTAGDALRAGLVHNVCAEDVPAIPRPLRARFAPINGPFRSVQKVIR